MSYEPKPGQYLHASCSDVDVYEIIGAGQDENGAPTIDVRVIDLDELFHFAHEDDAEGDGSDEKWFAPLTTAELPLGVHVILRGLQWRPRPNGYKNGYVIEVNAPEGGCYSCCYRMTVHASPGGRDPVTPPN